MGSPLFQRGVRGDSIDDEQVTLTGLDREYRIENALCMYLAGTQQREIWIE